MYNKVIHISKLAPPLGGVSKFLSRLKSYTDETRGEKEYIYVDTSMKYIDEKEKAGIVCISPISVAFYLMKQEPSIVVFHSNSAYHLFLNYIYSHKHRFVYFTHGESILKAKNRTGWRHRVLDNALYIITPTKELYRKVKDIFPNKSEIAQIPFILFPKEVEKLHNKELSALRSRTNFIFSVYANNLNLFNGEDLYGIDIAIEGLGELKKRGYKAGMVILISSLNNSEKFESYKKRISELQLENYVVIWNKNLKEAASLFYATDAYLRPTNTDGDSFSVWEALHLGIPVLASNATQRPYGCILFENRNICDLVEKSVHLIEKYETIRNNTCQLGIEGSEAKLLNFFEKLKMTDIK